MDKRKNILIVDDDHEICSLLEQYLATNGYSVLVAGDGIGLWRQLEDHPIDLIVLDLMLPGTDGLELCRNLRVQSQIPVIMLTARGDEMDRILGLEMGADDYLPKPFNPRELLARIKVILKRSAYYVEHDAPSDKQQVIVFSEWKLDPISRHLISLITETVTPLSGAEYRLLKVFLEHPNRILNRDQLLEFTQGKEAEPFDRSIDILVSRLRKRLMDDPKSPKIIQTIRGEGYILAAKVTNGECD